jgi:hypothetical protein
LKQALSVGLLKQALSGGSLYGNRIPKGLTFYSYVLVLNTKMSFEVLKMGFEAGFGKKGPKRVTHSWVCHDPAIGQASGELMMLAKSSRRSWNSQ